MRLTPNWSTSSVPQYIIAQIVYLGNCREKVLEAPLYAPANRTTGMFEVRAILLGRMGKHQAALEIYVYRLNNFAKAEE